MLVRPLEGFMEGFLELALDGKVVEVAAMLIVAKKSLDDYRKLAKSTIEDSVADNDPTPNAVSMLALFRVFHVAGDDIVTYVKEDKCNVCRLLLLTYDCSSSLPSYSFHLWCGNFVKYSSNCS